MKQPLFIIFLQLGIGGVQRKIVDIVNFLKDFQPDLPIYILLRNRTKFDLGNEIRNKKVKIIDYSKWLRVKIRFFFPAFVLYQVLKLKPKSILAFLDFSSLPAVLAKYVFFWKKIRVVLSEDHYASGVIAAQAWAKQRRFIVKHFYPLADTIFTCSEANKKDLIENYNLPKHKIKIITNWTTFRKVKLADNKKAYDFIYVGRLEKTKNLNFLLECMLEIKKTIPKTKLLILGEGKDENYLIKKTLRLGLKNNIVFSKPNHKVAQLLSKSKIFVYTSYNKVEGLPIAILESMAVGTPVLSRDFAGIQEFLTDRKNCYLFKSKKEFIKTAIFLLKNKDIRNKISQKAFLDIKKRHSSQNIMDYIKELNLEKIKHL